MQKFDYRLNVFSDYAKDVKTPEELYEAIDKLGPLPLYWTISVKQGDDSYDFESAKKEAHIVYEFAMRIAVNLRKSKQIQTPLPPPQNDPFLGISTIKEWCIDTAKTQTDSDKAGNNEKPAETEQNATAKRNRISNLFWNLYKETLGVIVDKFLDRFWPK